MNTRRQHIPDIDFDRFALWVILWLFQNKKIFINYDYQRGDVWWKGQQAELIRSIINSYSIGVLVLYINDNDQYEILDGQQRLLTIKKYLDWKLDLKGTDITPYDELPPQDKIFLDAYSVGYLKLKSHNPETKEEDIIQTFLRLQEWSPLNKAEKINAYRGKFKDTFREIRENHGIFNFLGNDKRFRLRLLCAELLHLELTSDFERGIFQGLELNELKKTCLVYNKEISSKKITFFKWNLDFLQFSLNNLLTAMTPRDLTPIYLLVSFLRRDKADNENLQNELSLFCEDFLQKLNSFSVYDTVEPEGMNRNEFLEYLNYKTQARKATSSWSIEFRFNFLRKKFQEYIPYIQKDPARLHNAEQKRTLFFRQKWKCTECWKPIDFRIDASSHHEIAHKDWGQTNDLENAVLLHSLCHQKLEQRIKKLKP